MPKGFFNLTTTDITRGDEQVKVSIPKTIKATCSECGLSNTCLSPKMQPTGHGRRKILIIGESPGKVENEKGTQFVGPSGQHLREILNELEIDLDKDCWKTNALQCFQEGNPDPTPLQIAACRNNVMKAIEQYKPKVIIPLGKWAMESLVGHRMTGRLNGLTITDWVGEQIPDQVLETYICPTWHPAYSLREKNTVVREQIKLHIKKALQFVDKPFYIHNYLSDCIGIKDVQEAIKILQDLRIKNIPLAFDYETTGIKPYRQGHKIYTVSISDGMYGYSFPFFNDEDFRREWKKFLLKTEKIAHNSKFESLWSKVRSGNNDSESIWPGNFIWDTMLAAHILANKKKVNLKFLTYCNFGVAGYDDTIDPYLEALLEEKKKYGDNAFNRVDKAPLDDLLTYNAADSLFTFKLWEEQSRKIDKHLLKGNSLFLDGVNALRKAEYNGVLLDTENAILEKDRITRKMIHIEKQVLNSDELKKWDRQVPFRVSAPQDLTHLLFDILKCKYDEDNVTATGKPKADVEALECYDIDVVKRCLEWRKWKKVRDTYLEGFIREETDSLIHTSFNLHRVQTYRSSSDGPNMQNNIKRDKEAATLLRRLIIARQGHKIAEYDYGSHEVRIISCVNKDPNLIAYVNNKNADLHRDMGLEIYLWSKDNLPKEDRQNAKSSFVFPTFYGSYWDNTSVDLWENATKETRQNLKENGIKNINQFKNHVKKVEDVFWNEKFPVAHEWMEKSLKNYEKNGYIDLLSGFRCYGPLSRNDILNYPVQGPAFHCLLYTFTNATEEFEELGLQSKIIGQIHDSIIIDIDPDEESIVDKIIWKWGTQEIRKSWEWIIVPLQIEKSISDIDSNWSEMKTIGLLTGE